MVEKSHSTYIEDQAILVVFSNYLNLNSLLQVDVLLYFICSWNNYQEACWNIPLVMIQIFENGSFVNYVP